MLLTFIMSIAMLGADVSETPQDDRISLTMNITKHDYDEEGNLTIEYSIPYPGAADQELPDVLYYDISDWAYPTFRTVLVRSPGKDVVQVAEFIPMFGVIRLDNKTPMRVLKAGDTISGYVKLEQKRLQKALDTLGIAPGDDYECMIDLALHADRKAPWVFEPSDGDRTVISVMDKSGEWKTRRFTDEEQERLRQALITTTRIIIPEEEEENFGNPEEVKPAPKPEKAKEVKRPIDPDIFRFRATSAWVKVVSCVNTH